MDEAGSPRDAETPEAVPSEHDVPEPRQGIDHRVGHDQGPCSSPPKVDVAEDAAHEEVAHEPAPSLIQVIGAPKHGARGKCRASPPSDLLEAADQVAHGHHLL